MSNPLLAELAKNKAVPWPEFFEPQENFTPEDIRSLEIKRAALMVILGMDDRFLQAIADELGVTRQAISKCGTDLARRIPGFDRFVRKPDAQDNSATAALKNWNFRKRKSPPADKTGGDIPTRQT